ncbi:unnamed protein product [Prunus armeniaca]|uniref:Uncharacterized protein n=1 Tax=Prunus armeniaca TaxID=36596 RepID=A0A6J5WHR4_PRUAR|nr:unnamed protein product [Prunus armeniaca]
MFFIVRPCGLRLRVFGRSRKRNWDVYIVIVDGQGLPSIGYSTCSCLAAPVSAARGVAAGWGGAKRARRRFLSNRSVLRMAKFRGKGRVRRVRTGVKPGVSWWVRSM